jgi:hypothetical protein
MYEQIVDIELQDYERERIDQKRSMICAIKGYIPCRAHFDCELGRGQRRLQFYSTEVQKTCGDNKEVDIVIRSQTKFISLLMSVKILPRNDHPLQHLSPRP